MAVEVNPVLVRPWNRPGQPILLGLDLWGGDRIHEIENIDEPGADLAEALLVFGGGAECRALAGGGLLVAEGVLWSLIDPLGAGNWGGPEGPERIDVEADLRHARRRFQAGLRWWRGAASPETSAMRSLLRGHGLDLGPLLDLLDRCPVESEAAEVQADPVEAGGSGDPFPLSDPEEIYSWLASGKGLGGLYGEGFAPRSEQAEMGREVSRALSAGQTLLVEAGTGVGKTLAYLVPLLARVAEGGGRGVVSTHTRALQRQILDQDLPRLQRALPGTSFALLMGRRNYLCLRQRQAYLTRPIEDAQTALQVASFRLWLRATCSGMREELADHPLLGQDLRELFDAADICLPGLCYEGDRCFVQKARRKARGADLLVVNHSLLLHDLRAGHTLLGEYHDLVVDEAHRLPSVALETHAIACGVWRLDEVEDLLGSSGAGGGLPARVQLCAQRLDGSGAEGKAAAVACEAFGHEARRATEAFRAWWRAVGADLAETLPGPESLQVRTRIRDKAASFGPSRDVAGTCLEQLGAAAAACARFCGLASAVGEVSGALQDDLAQLAQAGQLFGQLHQDIHFLVEDPDEQWVTWAEPGRRRTLRVLGATLLESGGLLREYWLGSDLNPILTSATLAVGEDFTHMLQELGLTRRRPPTRTYIGPSPFDYHEQSLVLTPTHFLAPDAPGFPAAVGEVLAALVLGTGRKTMGLFTSYRHLREAAETLKAAGILPPGQGGAHGRPVLLQQDSGAQAGSLLTTFRRQHRAVLLGTSSFWEGVDFPGEDLEILVVVKLPFLVPSDPWVEGRCEKVAAGGDNPFTDFMVRDAVLRLKQGFGRLIRRPTDRGVVVILDNRLHTKNYGTTFLNGLPVLPRTFGDNQELLARIEAFFRRD